ncbi:mannosyltransferase [Ophidiomyces ophidiicola]|uniref:Mannosyltransferase n=1 Tax=Ophidiomyces ophidiicola TaxID=1387563 RepID=A0ACB8UVN8_9EURO|nr:mannosyltransferase [Ophidiomyces ophidiicola]KAI1924078.1 mannosyltransferase [Ophidiomyces ophidiicola]KAI1925046.1 mannosyltransferase [Ophidiomyces ophidiicola]KAI2010657.1 mannosyltransferase [Ophidiomyces ophidiicola]KAI2016021.1 mannosyltransferase [Ophidiomyces ophidiicola]
MAAVHLVLAVCLSLPPLLFFGFVWLRPTRRTIGEIGSISATSVQIVVLGDIGHSPRMQYHAQSVAKHGGRVTIIGYQVSPPNPDLLSDPLVTIVPLPPPPVLLQTNNAVLFPLLSILKVIQQIWSLWMALAYSSDPAEWMIIQNPPAIPTLLLALLTCWLRNSRLIIDWHNFGFSILALKLGQSHPMVWLMKWYEMTLSRMAFAHFCVSNAMASILRAKMNIGSTVLVLHDRPASLFQPITNQKQRFEFLTSLPETREFAHHALSGKSSELLVSSTSWTPDEDFSLLLQALCQYSTYATTTNTSLPELHVIITGKGPQQRMYLQIVESLIETGKLKKVSITCAWLTIENYARLLACSSLGVCLHTSSSGVDLPMKVVDMFGAGLPVVGWNKYEAWAELVTEGVDGRGFSSAEELSKQLIDLFGQDRSDLESLRHGARNASRRRWGDEWDSVAGKLLRLV